MEVAILQGNQEAARSVWQGRGHCMCCPERVKLQWPWPRKAMLEDTGGPFLQAWSKTVCEGSCYPRGWLTSGNGNSFFYVGAPWPVHLAWLCQVALVRLDLLVFWPCGLISVSAVRLEGHPSTQAVCLGSVHFALIPYRKCLAHGPNLLPRRVACLVRGEWQAAGIEDQFEPKGTGFLLPISASGL